MFRAIAGLCKSIPSVGRLLPALLEVSLDFNIPTPNREDRTQENRLVNWLHAGRERPRFRGFRRRLAAVQTAKTMQALAARTTSSYSCSARFCPECHHSLRASDTMDPGHASIRVLNRAIMSSSSDTTFRVAVSSTLTRHTGNGLRPLLADICDTADKHRDLADVYIHMVFYTIGDRWNDACVAITRCHA